MMSAFDTIIHSDKPVLVDFFAEWCGPCKTFAPVLKEIASEVDGRARVIKVDVDKNPQVAAKYDIQAVPTLIIFKNGEIKWRQPGAAAKHDVLKAISALY